MKKAVIVLVILFFVVSFPYNRKTKWKQCLNKNTAEIYFTIFRSLLYGQGYRFTDKNSYGEFKNKFIIHEIDFFKKAGVFCGRTQALTPQELWERSKYFLEDAQKTWKDFKAPIGDGWEVVNFEVDLEKTNFNYWRKEFFIDLLIIQKRMLLLNTPKETRLENLPTPEELISELDPETKKKFRVINPRWEYFFQKLRNDIYYITIVEAYEESKKRTR